MRELLRWSSAAAFVVTALLYLGNAAAYTGCTIGDSFWWRLEHGRLNMRRNPGLYTNGTDFYAANAEEMRWNFEGKNRGGGSWEVAIPLWAPLGFFALVFASASLFSRPVRERD